MIATEGFRRREEFSRIRHWSSRAALSIEASADGAGG